MSVNTENMSIHYILQDILTLDISSYNNSSFHIDDHELNFLVLKLMRHWSTEVNNTKSTQCSFESVGDRLTTKKVVQVVEFLKCHTVFCQILLLIPEKIKSKLVFELCNMLKTSEYPEFTQTLLHQTSSNYSQNIMGKISSLDKSVVNCFFNNVLEIIKSNSDMMLNNARFVLQFLDHFLGNYFLIGTYYMNAFTLLDKNGKRQVRELLKVCRSSPNIIICKEGDYLKHLADLLQFEKYSSILIHLYSILTKYEKDDLLLMEEYSEGLFSRVCCKTNGLFKTLSSEEISNPRKQEMTTVIESFQERLSSLTYVADDVNLNINQSYDSPHLMIAKWRVEQNKEKKFHMAICCVGNLYYGHEEALSWLLLYENFNNEKENVFINNLTAYAINFGSVSFIKRLMMVLYQRNDANANAPLAHAIQKVIINSLPYLTISSCNNIISSFKGYFKPYQSLLWSLSHTKEQFYSSLKELFNKLTSGKKDSLIFIHLAQLSVVSPFVVLEELIDRIFAGTLNHSVLKNILVSIPTFFELELHSKPDECTSPILCFVRTSYMNSTDNHAAQNMISITNVLMEVVPDSLRSNFYHILCDFFIVSNLSLVNINKVFDLNITLDVMAVLLRNLDLVSANYNISFCQMLLDIMENNETDIVSVKNSDCMNNLIQVLVSNLSQKCTKLLEKEKLTILSSARYMIGRYSWVTPFYFYELFLLNNYEFPYVVPNSLIEFCNLFGHNIHMFTPLSNSNPSQDDNDDNDDDEEKWISLFQICSISCKASYFFIECLPVFSADEEMCNIVEGVAKVLPPHASVDKGNSLIGCLTYIVQKQRIDGVETWFRKDLCNEIDHHGMCFSMLILIQAFQIHYSDLEEETKYEKGVEIQNYMKVFHLFLLYAKDIEVIEVRSSILLYLLEQLIFIMSALGEFIASTLSLLLMDIVIALLDCIKSSGDISNQIVEECQKMLDGIEGNHGIALKEKFNGSLKI